MGAVDNIVRIAIVQQTGSTPTSTTTIPLVLGVTNPGWDEDDYVHAYQSASEMLDDGFKYTDPEYVYALALTAQKTVPGEFLVGRRKSAGEPATAQVDKVSLDTAAASTVYKLTANGKVYSYTSTATDNAAQVLAGLKAAITNDAAAAILASIDTGTNDLVLTAKVAGVEIAYTALSDGLELTNETAAAAAKADPLSIDDLEAVQTQDDSWYGLLLPQATDDDILVASGWIESQKKLLFAVSAAPEIADAQSTEDIAATLQARNQSRTALMFSPKSAKLGIEAAWVGGQLPRTPGSNTWMFKELLGIAPDKLTSRQVSVVAGIPVAGTEGKSANVYTEVQHNVPMTQAGRCSSGQFVDVTVGVDWLYFNLSSSIFSTIQQTDGKLPYDEGGVAVLKGAVAAVLGLARDNKLINDGFTVTAPSVDSVPQAQRANRIAPTISFTCTLKGAIHAVTVSGSVSV